MLNVEAPLPAVSHESLIQGDGRVRLGGAGKAGAAGGGVRVQGELGHHQQGTACLLQIQIHFAVFILKDPQVADFLRQAVGAGKVMLTSNPSRGAARRLYAKMGFKEAETTVFACKTDTE